VEYFTFYCIREICSTGRLHWLSDSSGSAPSSDEWPCGHLCNQICALLMQNIFENNKLIHLVKKSHSFQKNLNPNHISKFRPKSYPVPAESKTFRTPFQYFPSFLHLRHSSFGPGGIGGGGVWGARNTTRVMRDGVWGAPRGQFWRKDAYLNMKDKNIISQVEDSGWLHVHVNAKLSSKIWNTDTVGVNRGAGTLLLFLLHKGAPRTHCDCSFREIQTHLRFPQVF
jgi:hypothetical protein